MQQSVYVLVGYPASGKSTWANWFVTTNSNLIILDGDVLKTSKKVEKELMYKLNEGRSVIVDACNHSLKRRSPLIQQCKQRNIPIFAIYFKIPLEVCKARAKIREEQIGKHIPAIAYNKMKKDFVEPSLPEGFLGISFIENF